MKRTIFIVIVFVIGVLTVTDCTHNRRRATSNSHPYLSSRQQTRSRDNNAAKSTVKMQKRNGVYYVPCKINGMEMQFIFDTGASDITMSSAEAIVLYKQGKLSDDDFVGVEQYQIADGSISEGSVVILRSVEIGGRKISNVRASIVQNMEAPLLLGQSVLSKFGKISIDYYRSEISFE